MPTVTLLVGLPGVGKPTWISKNLSSAETHIFSTDNLIQESADKQGLTYDQLWSSQIKAATKQANRMLDVAIAERRDVISDRTNLSSGARKKFLSKFPKVYRKVAVVFTLAPADLTEWKRRLSEREKVGKTISNSVLENMMASYDEPSMEEGFNRIVYLPFS